MVGSTLDREELSLGRRHGAVVLSTDSVAKKLARVPREAGVVVFGSATSEVSEDTLTVSEDTLTDSGNRVSDQRSWSGCSEILFNVIGTCGFVVGSLLWAIGIVVPGTLIFAGSCIFCGIACMIYSVKFYKSEDYVGVYALLQQALGCLIFTICSFLFLEAAYERIALIGFFAASLLFLTGCILTQVMCRSWMGVVAFLWPGNLRLLCTSFLNTAGSVLFTIGSILLFYDWGQAAGAYCYLIGSIFFALASWGDATVWWDMGLTQSEHPDVAQNTASFYARVKFL